MQSITQESASNPASALRTAAKTLSTGLQRTLPAAAFDRLMDKSFGAYRAFLLHSYGRRCKALQRSGDVAGFERADLVHRAMRHSLVGSRGLEHTFDLARELIAEKIPGAFVECGVARGGSAALIGTIAQRAPGDRTCWFFDSFEGLPDPTEKDAPHGDGDTGSHIRPLPKGSCLGTLEEVRAVLFEDFHLDPGRVRLVKGWFDQTLHLHRDAIGPIALLRLDGDWYESTRCCLERLYPLVSPGGGVLIDDYFSCHGAKAATDELLAECEEHPLLVADGSGGASFRKPADPSLPGAA